MAWNKAGNIKGADGVGLPVTTAAVSTVGLSYRIEVDIISDFALGDYVHISDGTNAVYAPVSVVYPQASEIDLYAPAITVLSGSITSIAVGTKVTFAGPPGSMGAGATETLGASPITLNAGQYSVDVKNIGAFLIGSYMYTKSGANSLMGEVTGVADIAGATNGTLYVTASTVTGNPTLIGEHVTVTLAGTPGDKGEQGDKGDKGDKGDTGPTFLEKHITIEAPESGDNITWFFTNKAISLTQLRIGLQQSAASPSCSIVIRHATSRNASGTVAYTGSVTSITTGTNVTWGTPVSIPADNFVWVVVGTTTNTEAVHASLFGTYD